jgi:hypothetical protein
MNQQPVTAGCGYRTHTNLPTGLNSTTSMFLSNYIETHRNYIEQHRTTSNNIIFHNPCIIRTDSIFFARLTGYTGRYECVNHRFYMEEQA